MALAEGLTCIHGATDTGSADAVSLAPFGPPLRSKSRSLRGNDPKFEFITPTPTRASESSAQSSLRAVNEGEVRPTPTRGEGEGEGGGDGGLGAIGGREGELRRKSTSPVAVAVQQQPMPLYALSSLKREFTAELEKLGGVLWDAS